MIMKNSNSQQNPNLDSEQQESKPTLLCFVFMILMLYKTQQWYQNLYIHYLDSIEELQYHLRMDVSSLVSPYSS